MEHSNCEIVEPVGPCPEIARIRGAHEREVRLDDVTCRYLTAGSGPALLLIHGFMGYSFSWRFNIEPLAQQFSVYAVDLPGCGFSQRSDRLKGTLRGDAEMLLYLLAQAGIERAHVLGTSRGGGVAIALAALAVQRGLGDRIVRLILNAPINPWSSNGRILTRILATAIGGMYVVHVQPRLPFVLERYFRGLYGDPRRIAPGSLEGYEAGFKPTGTFEHLLRIVRSWHSDLALIEESLPAIANIPTLLLWGPKDNAVYFSSAAEFQRRLKNSTVLLMEGVGHMPYEETPEEFNRIVSQFLLRGVPRTPLESEQPLTVPKLVPLPVNPHGSAADRPVASLDP